MSAGYVLTPRALGDLEEIAAFVTEQGGADVARRVVTELRNSFRKLAAHPGIGHVRDELAYDEDRRSLGVYIVHGARSPSAIRQHIVRSRGPRRPERKK